MRRTRPRPIRSRRFSPVLLLALLLGTALAGCGPAVRQGGPGSSGGGGLPTGDAPIGAWNPTAGLGVEPRVGLLLPLSGPQAELGRAMQNAAELAVQDFADGRFVLLPRDTMGTPEGARAAAEQVLADGATLILGPLLGSSVAAVREIASAQGVNIISFSSDRTVAGGGAFIMGFLPRDQVERVMQFAGQRGARRFAVLAPQTPYGELIAEESRRAADLSGGVVTKVMFYDPTAADVSETVKLFANYDSRSESQRATGAGLDFEAVVLPEGGIRLLQVAPLLPFYDVDPDKVLFLGTGQWDSPIVFQEPNLRGGLFAAPLPTSRLSFVQKYRSTFVVEPPRLATLAYDATGIAAVLAREPGGADYSVGALTDANGWAGADGIFRFLPDGTVERGLAVLRIDASQFAVVNPPPPSFQALTQ